MIADAVPFGSPALAYVVVALGSLVLIGAGLWSNSPRKLVLWPLISALVVGLGATVCAHLSIVSSRSSTAAVGLIFLPIIFSVVVTVAFAISWSLLYMAQFAREAVRRPQPGTISNVGVLIALLILTATATGVVYGIWRQQLLHQASRSSEAESLRSMVDRAVSVYDADVLSRLAENPHVTDDDLERIFYASKNRMEDHNSAHYSVFRSLARNPRTPPKVLNMLAGCEEGTRTAVAMNPGTPKQALWQLAKDLSPYVRQWLTVNPAVPQELLRQLAQDPDPRVRGLAETHLKNRR